MNNRAFLNSLLLLFTAALCSCAGGRAGAEPPYGNRPWPIGEEDIPDFEWISKAGDKGVADTIRNPSFENLRESNLPADWSNSQYPEVREEVLPGGGTNRFAHVNRVHNLYQFVDYPVSPWQSITIGARYKSEQGIELADMYFISGPASGGEPKSYRAVVRPPANTTDWVPFFASNTRRPTDDRTAIFLRARQDVAWADFDDLFLVTEGIANGDFDADEPGQPGLESWRLLGEADIVTTSVLSGTRSLLLGSGGTAERVVAHTPYVTQYFITGEASAPFLLEEIRLNSAGEALDEATTGTVQLDSNGRFLMDLPRSDSAEAARIRLSNNEADSVVIDDLSRGWAYVWPPRIAIASNSPSKPLRFAAAWPFQLETAEIAILDSEGNEAMQLDALQFDGTSLWREFDGGDLPAGDYTAQFRLTAASSASVVVERPFKIERPAPFQLAPMANNLPFIPRIAWFWMSPFSDLDVYESPQELASIFALAHEDGYNMVLVSADSDQLSLLKEAAAIAEMPFIIYMYEYATVYDSEHGNYTFDPLYAYDRLDLFDPLLDSPWFQGVYLFDEPNGRGREFTHRIQDVMILMERTGKYPTPYCFLNPGPPIHDASYTVLSTFDYPILHRPTPPEDLLIEKMEELSDDRDYAVSIDKPYWIGVQGYGTVLTSEAAIPTLAEQSAHLGMSLAIGFRGYFVFVWKNLSIFAAPRGPEGEPSKRLPVFQDFNRRIAAMESFLLSLEDERIKPVQENVFVRIAQNRNREAFAFIVNYHPKDTARIEISTSLPTRLIDVETGESTEQLSTPTLTLGPGEWTIRQIESGETDLGFHAQLNNSYTPKRAPVRELETIPGDQRLVSLALNPNGLNVAGISNSTGNLRIFSLEEEDRGTVLYDRYFDSYRSGLDYLAPNVLARSSRRFGLAVYQQDRGTLDPLYTYQRESGGARDVVFDGPDAWIAQNYWGVTKVQFQNNDSYQRQAFVVGGDYDYVSIDGPFENNRTIAVELIRGVHQFDEADGELVKTRLSRRATYNEGAMWEKSRLAVPMIDGEVHLFDFDSAGNPVNEVIIDDPDLVQPTETTWIDGQILAVLDPRFGVRFYRIYNDGFWIPLGLWAPPAPFYLTSFDSLPGGQMAVALYEGPIILLDASTLFDIGRVTGWALY